MMARYLGYLGYRVETAADAGAAMRICETDHPCLIFADLMLPHVDGEAFVEELRDRFGDAAPPVVVLSASLIRNDIARRVGAAATLRSEERRVGKEGGSQWARYPYRN